MRAKLQVLLIPFVKNGDGYEYAMFHRTDMDLWQFIAGGGEDNETPLEAVKREAKEEANISGDLRFLRLASVSTIPIVHCGHDLVEGESIVMSAEVAFGVELESKDLKLSHEHKEVAWFSCEEATKRLKYDSNKSALWELNYRLNNGGDVEKNIKNIQKYIK